MFSPSKNESVEERKRRERVEFLSLPPEEAQRRIGFDPTAPLRIVSPLGCDFRSSLLPPLDDETVDR